MKGVSFVIKQVIMLRIVVYIGYLMSFVRNFVGQNNSGKVCFACIVLPVFHPSVHPSIHLSIWLAGSLLVCLSVCLLMFRVGRIS